MECHGTTRYPFWLPTFQCGMGMRSAERTRTRVTRAVSVLTLHQGGEAEVRGILADGTPMPTAGTFTTPEGDEEDEGGEGTACSPPVCL